ARHISSFRRAPAEETAVALAQRMLKSMGARQPAEALSLEVVPISQVVPHEAVDEKRVGRLMERLESDGRLVNPPVVTHFQDRYIVLDGATRFTALKRLGYPYVIVQIVPHEGDDFALHTWFHVISKDRPFEELRSTLAEIEGLELTALAQDKIREALHEPATLCYFLDCDGRAWLARRDPAAGRLAVMNGMVDAYTRWGEVERTLQTDLGRLKAQYPKLAAVAIFPQFAPETVFQVASRGQRLPAGLTRFVIPGRILRLNADLTRLRQDEPLAAKRAWLNQLLAEKLARSRLRYYTEPVVLLDE
ncbi:MAG: ParB N-terminal domain-containing protein, partial [Candidatus Promineifilaceae bacterium]